jgi:HlyD family secretion protein
MSKKKKSARKWIFLGLFVIIAAVVIALGMRQGDDGIEVTLESVERGDITSIVTATGRVQPEVEVVISSEVPGEIIALPVRDGDRVERGDLLARVNPDTLEAQVKQQEAALASTRASSAQRRAEMLQAELDLQRARDLFDRGFATQEELDQASTRLEVARAALESANFQIQRQEMQLKEANDLLAKASLYAPISGTVVSLSSELGDRVVGTGQFAGTTIMRIADLSNMEVQVDVSEADIINVDIGQQALVEVDALPDTEIRGAVTEIANSAATSGNRSQEQLTTFAVRIRLKDAGQRLRPGMTATADIETETVTDVVRAPLGSVVVRPRREVEGRPEGEEPDAAESENGEAAESDSNRRNGEKKDDRVRVVFVAGDGKAILRQVETGIADRDFIEIRSGLEAGESIITGSYRALTRELEDGSAITERKPSGDKPDRAGN